MTIKRDPEELPSGAIVNVLNDAGVTVDANKEEYEEMIRLKKVSYPSSHTTNAMTLADVHPGYVP
jgi:hypothetical protein